MQPSKDPKDLKRDLDENESRIRLPDGRWLAYARFGDPNGVPVFGFHGTPGSRRQFAVVHETAQRLGVHCILPDRPGYGASSYHPRRKLVDWPEDVAALADALSIGRFGVFGVSGGGCHALACAHAFGARLLGVAVVSGMGPMAEPEIQATYPPRASRIARFAIRMPALARLPLAYFRRVVRRRPDAFRERMLRRLMDHTPTLDRDAFLRPENAGFLDDYFDSIQSASSRAPVQDLRIFVEPWGFRLEDIALPVSFWHGDRDRTVPIAHSEFMASRVPGSTFHRMPGEGHFMALNHGERILQATLGS